MSHPAISGRSESRRPRWPGRSSTRSRRRSTSIGSTPATTRARRSGLNALVTKPSSEAKWSGPYLKKAVPLDPWGRAYQYKSPGDHGDFDLISFGKDGQPGGAGEAEDIKNW